MYNWICTIMYHITGDPLQKTLKHKVAPVLIGCGFFVALLISSPAQAESWYRELNTNVEESGLDKGIHIAIGTGISYYAAEHTSIERWQAALIPTAIGLIKESTDKNFDTGDLLSWAVSGVVGAYMVPGLRVYCANKFYGASYTFEW